MIAGRELALAILAVLDAPPADVVEVAAAAGFDAVTLRLGGGNRERPDEPESHPLIGDTPTRRATVRRLRETGLGVLDVEVLRLRPETDVVAVQPMLESAQALGARHLLVVGLDDDEARMVDTFAALCAEAEPYGVRPALEFMRMSSVSDRSGRRSDRLCRGSSRGGGSRRPAPPGALGWSARRRRAAGRGAPRSLFISAAVRCAVGGSRRRNHAGAVRGGGPASAESGRWSTAVARHAPSPAGGHPDQCRGAGCGARGPAAA